MAFLRIKPIKKASGKIYNYVYEVESYKHKGRVRQRYLQILGPYIELEKKKRKSFPENKALQAVSKEQLFKEILAHNLKNYGLAKEEDDVWTLNDIVVNLKALRVFQKSTNRDVYLNINEKFLGTHTLKKLMKSDDSSLIEFVKSIVDAGLINRENKEDFKLLQFITDKFKPKDTMKEAKFEDFSKEVGY